METKPYKARYAIMLSVMLVVIALFLVRLIQWQVIQADYYDDLIDSGEKYTVTGEAVRGEIYDVNGVELAVNLTGYKIVLNKIYIDNEDLNDIISRLVDIMDECDEYWTDELPILLDENGEYVFDEEKQDEIDTLKSKSELNMNPYSTAAECMVKLVERYECEKYPKEQQRNIVSVRYNMTRMAYSKTQPYTFADSISTNSMSIVTERMNDVKGVTVESTAIRTYTNGTIAPHIVGVTGLISQDEYTELQSKGYSFTDSLGKSGIEYAYESELRGTAGTKTYEIEPDGNVLIEESQSTKPGNSVYLTLDARMQVVAQKALKEAVKEANDYAKEVDDKSMGADCKGAAVVVLNVKDFSVLCAANYPSYDLSKYYDDYSKLATDETVPLFDRAFMGALAPGSTFKPLVASAALQEKKITIHTSITCDGVYTTGGLKLWCMGYHGDQDLYNAMKNSCNVYFAETGRLLGIENIDAYAKRCGLGIKTGVEVTESAGTLAGPEYSELMGSEWYESFVSQAAIGQSDNQFTPLQLATYAATIANNGKRMRTHVVDKVVSYSGKDIIYQSEPEIVDEMGVSEKNLKEVQKAMNIAASNYDALSGFDINIAGKTGTAENSGSDHANFICYAPYDDPQIAIGVMVEHGAKSYVAINVAKKMINAYFKGEGIKDIPDIGVTVVTKEHEESSKESSKENSKADKNKKKTQTSKVESQVSGNSNSSSASNGDTRNNSSAPVAENTHNSRENTEETTTPEDDISQEDTLPDDDDEDTGQEYIEPDDDTGQYDGDTDDGDGEDYYEPDDDTGEDYYEPDDGDGGDYYEPDEDTGEDYYEPDDDDGEDYYDPDEETWDEYEYYE